MKDPQYPFFSIVVPVYNRAALLQETVKSIQAQSFSSYEIIIVDDGSTDGSGPEIDRLYGDASNILIIHQANQERGASRNNGFKKATGDYVIFLDSDDLLLPVHLQVLYDKIMELKPDFISTKYDFLRNGKRVRSIISDSSEGYYDYRFFLNGNPYGCNVCVRRLNEKLCLFEEDRRYSIKEDWLFFLENLQGGQKVYLVDQVTLVMVDHDERSMRQNDRSKFWRVVRA